MPWATGKEFAGKHNHKLKGKAAQKAADQATALVNKGMDEGEAIAIANKTGNKMQGALSHHAAEGVMRHVNTKGRN